jgi:uncharacterized membrane protein
MNVYPAESPRRPLAGPAERISSVTSLDGAATAVARFSARQRGAVADLARGEPLGHPLHPALTDLPIGFWTSAFVLDLVGGRRHAGAARMLVAAGVLSAIPTAVAGLADLPTLGGRKRRVALVHAGANTVATALYAKSWWARRRRPIVGVAIGFVAAATATFGGFLGGWMAFGAAKPRERSTARSQVA